MWKVFTLLYRAFLHLLCWTLIYIDSKLIEIQMLCGIMHVQFVMITGNKWFVTRTQINFTMKVIIMGHLAKFLLENSFRLQFLDTKFLANAGFLTLIWKALDLFLLDVSFCNLFYTCHCKWHSISEILLLLLSSECSQLKQQD